MRRRELLAAPAAALAGLPAPAATLRGLAPLVIDAHNHLHHHRSPTWAEDDRKLIDAAGRLGIQQLCCSILPPERPTPREGFYECNRWVLEAMKRFPDRILGYCFVNPGYGQEALDEVRRCVEERGFIGVKLYNDYKVTSPVVAPLLELAARMKFPILQHAGHTSWLPSPQPEISDAGDLAEAARRFPETTLICAHVCGGGDWEWSIKALRDANSVYFDTSGSVADEGTVEMAVEVLGAERVLFATDLSFTASVGRLIGARIAPAQKRLVLGGNMQRIIDKMVRL
jgi:predicted TIM-barrel fold metal-dependent hydrolase